MLAPSYGILGLTTAFVLASIFNALSLFILLRNKLSKEAGNHEQVLIFDKELATSVLKVSFASIVMGLICYGLIQLIGPHINTRTVFGIIIQCGISGSVGVAGFILLCILLKVPQTDIVVDWIRRIYEPRKY